MFLWKKLPVAFILLLIIFSSSYAAKNNNEYTRPKTIEGVQCTIMCSQDLNLCKLVQYAEAKRSTLELVEVGIMVCQAVYDKCFTDCGGVVQAK